MRGRVQLGGESMAEPACICLQCQSTFRRRRSWWSCVSPLSDPLPRGHYR